MPIRSLSFLLLLLCAGPAFAAGPHHDLDVTLDPAARRLEVVDRIRLPPGERTLWLSPALAVSEASVAGRPLPVRREGGRIRLTVPADAATGDGAEVILRYGGTLAAFGSDDSGDGPLAGEEGAFLPEGSGWIPAMGGEPPSWRLSVRVPAPFVAVATGRLLEEGRGPEGHRAVFAEDRPVGEPSLFAGPWTVRERMHGGLRLRTYFHPEQAELSDGYLDLTARTIDDASARIGVYPFDGFAILSAPLPVGYGFPGLTYIGRQVMPLPFIRSQSLAHEILHNWWGNGIRVGEGGNWAEGLTTFMADHESAARRSPEAARAMRLDWLRDFAALPPERDMPLTAFRARGHDASQIVGYGKAAFLFHMLEGEIGKDAFSAGSRRFWETNQFRDAGWSDLRRAFEAASARDLGPFFAQWLERSGAPVLQLKDVRAEDGRVTVTAAQDEPAYGLSIPVAIETAAGIERHVLRLDGRQATASFTPSAPARAVALDPDQDLFRRLAPGEAPPILRDVTLDPATDVVVAAEGEADDAARELARRLMDGPPRLVPASGADGSAPLALIGTAEAVEGFLTARGLPPMPEVAATAQGVTARVWTFRTPKGRPVLAVAGRDAAALRALLRPLPHYGRQSWLLFDGSRVAERGVWPAGDSPLRRAVGTEGK
ncbi:M1 family aminopeptidase [Azospirillum sp. SYSU D00513]|uniref:M1 family metallopeptidase n=1 Tax=Azospirillum sp. SYSU D00513 TaxID=2812561 RepID=UPI001A977C4C|nr:M1 family aminopeptidase [Azospirillum sp. SYSU D00513]